MALESMRREDYVALIELLDLEPFGLQQMVFTNGRVVATVIERDETGRPRISGDEVLVRDVVIPIKD